MFPNPNNPNALRNLSVMPPEPAPFILTKREYFILMAPIPEGLSSFAASKWAMEWADYVMGVK